MVTTRAATRMKTRALRLLYPPIRLSPYFPEEGPDSAFNFLGLPSELRSRIYKELLVLDRWQIQSCHHWDVTWSLLMASKFIRKEVLPVLYENNMWCVLSLDEDADAMLQKEFGPPTENFFWDKTFQSPPRLTLKGERPRARTTTDILCTIHDLPRICRTLVLRNWDWVAKMSLPVINGNMAAERHTRAEMVDRLSPFYWLEDNGFRKYIEQGVNAVESGLQVVRGDGTVLSSIFRYLDAVIENQQTEDWPSARSGALECFVFIQEVCDIIPAKTDPWSQQDIQQVARYRSWWLSATLNIIKVSLALRDNVPSVAIMHKFANGTELFRNLTRKQGIPLTAEEVAKFQCSAASVFRALGMFNRELYSLFEALLAVPGYIEADEAVDDLEAFLKENDGSSRKGVLLSNLDGAMKPVRHFHLRAEDNQPWDEEQADQLRKTFEGSVAEIDMLASRKSNGLGLAFMLGSIDEFLGDAQEWADDGSI